MTSELFQHISHPNLLAVAALISAASLPTIFRFFFDDFETFKEEAGLRSELDRSLWAFGWFRTNYMFAYKLVGIFGAYLLVVFAVYQFLVILLT